MASEEPVMVSARFEGDDLALLEALVAEERLTRSDVIRRAVRSYAKQLGVSVKPTKPKRK